MQRRSGSGSSGEHTDLAEIRRFAGAPSRTTLWRSCRQGRFPKPLKLGPNRRGWARDPEGWAARAAKAGERGDRED